LKAAAFFALAMPGAPAADAERWLADLKRGGTKLAILQLIREQDRYGYEIVSLLKERSDGVLSLAEGNVYPALHGLEQEGAVASYWREIEPGVPPRKYYRITREGLALHDRMVKTWSAYTKALSSLLNGGPKR
jgi:PadR family transcriptional regulator, regulatory protein PadR